ncbi:hypothetical protein [Dactylosporangium sp. NPDC005555]|uniref:hypothetical protein n=1 Tax=Dactylosporangium sp. NPDC005555 TaxID=3154889 RepID=UPI0033A1EA59
MLEPVGWWTLVPLGVASLVTGVVQSLGTSWGLVRHYWVLFKLVMNSSSHLFYKTIYLTKDLNQTSSYVADGDGLHRSEPIVVKTSDPPVGLYLSKVADPDGSDEHIELVMLELVDRQPWHLTEPLHGREILMSIDRAEAVRHALAELV